MRFIFPNFAQSLGDSTQVCFAGGVIKVKELDWLRDDLCTGAWPPHSGPRSFVAPRATLRPSTLWP